MGRGGVEGRGALIMAQLVPQPGCVSSLPILAPATTARPVDFSTKDTGGVVGRNAQEESLRRQGVSTREVGVVVIHPCIIL